MVSEGVESLHLQEVSWSLLFGQGPKDVFVSCFIDFINHDLGVVVD